MSVPISYSFFDLLKDPLFRMAAKQDDKSLMNKCFWDIGIDTKEFVEIIEANHRPKTSNDPWFGLMVSGLERRDKEWLTSGYASYEAQIYTSNPFLRDELEQLDPRAAHRSKRQYDEDIYVEEALPEGEDLVNVIDEVGDCC